MTPCIFIELVLYRPVKTIILNQFCIEIVPAQYVLLVHIYVVGRVILKVRSSYRVFCAPRKEYHVTLTSSRVGLRIIFGNFLGNTVDPRLSGPQLTGRSLYPADCLIPRAHGPINAHCSRIFPRAGAANMLFRVKAILDRLNRWVRSIK